MTSVPEAEQALGGGRITTGVVRIGDTVRRPAQPNSRFVAKLLAHLEVAGFSAAPRHLGSDDRGRDVLTYMAGDVNAHWRRYDDEQVAAAARMLRSLHDATAGCDLAGRADVVCHGDPGPNNVVFQRGRPAAFIDFDFAAPGTRLQDVAYMAWSWCISSRSDRGPAAEQWRQVRGLCDAYGLDGDGRKGLPDAVIARQILNAAWWRDRRADEVAAWSEREAAFAEALTRECGNLARPR